MDVDSGEERLVTVWVVVFLAGVVAGVQNALAGGGSFVTLGVLVFAGLDPRAANVTSTIALFPGQVATGYVGRHLTSGAEGLSFRALVVISLVGGIIGALILLATPSSTFARLVPWLVLFATGVFAWGSFTHAAPYAAVALGPRVAAGAQFLIAIYGGYFGGGIGFLMLAALTLAGLPVQRASANKNVLAAVMNASAVFIFLFSNAVHWREATVLGLGATVGGVLGAALLTRANDRWLRIGVIVLGVALTVALFMRGT